MKSRTTRFVITLAGLFLALSGAAVEPRATNSASLGRSHFAAFGTNRVHYVTAGSGAYTVLFVHCWAGNSGFWREQVPVLADRALLILVDLPGHGLSDKSHTNYTADFFASAVVAVLRDVGVDRATLVGHSMGVPVICRVYAQAPDKVAALVAIDGQLRRPAITRDEFEQFVAPFSAPNYREHTTRFIGSLFPSPGTEALRDRVVADLLKTPQYVMSSAMAGMFGPDQPDWDVKKANVPVLVINATNPRWTAEYEDHVRSLSAQTEYRTIDGVGHWLMLEKPAEFNATLVEMLKKYDLISPVEFRSRPVGPNSGGRDRSQDTMENIAKKEFKTSWGSLMTVNLLRAPGTARYKYMITVSAYLPPKEDWRYRDFHVEVRDHEGHSIRIFEPGRPDDPLDTLSGLGWPCYLLDCFVDAPPSAVPESVEIWLRKEHYTARFSQ